MKRGRKKEIQGIAKQRGRKPAKTLQEYKRENKRLRMENELLDLREGSESQGKIRGNLPASR